jgi:TRAP-type C4-dicarboxylate transport system permease small subunit
MLETTLRRVSLLLSRVGGSMLLAAALLVAVEVTLRKTRIAVFSLGTELSSYALAIGAAWAFAHVVFERAHVRVDVATQRLPRLPRAVFDVVAMASLAVVGAFLSMGAWNTFHASLLTGTTSNTSLAIPLAIPQGLWLFGIGWFTLIAFYCTLTAAAALACGDLAEVSRIAAPPSVDEEISLAAGDIGENPQAKT